jgi:hypothetical protein
MTSRTLYGIRQVYADIFKIFLEAGSEQTPADIWLVSVSTL